MRQRKINRRTILKAAAALAATGLAPRVLFAQSGAGSFRKALPVRGEFVIRGANILSMDSAIGDFARGDVHVRDGAIVAVAAEIAAPAATVHRCARHDLHARLHRHALAPVDQRMPADHPRRRSEARLFSRHQPPRPLLHARRQLSRGPPRTRRGAFRRRHHGAQLGAQRPLARTRRRRAARDARHRTARPLLLRSGAGHAQRQADGSRRAGEDQARVDAQRRHAHAGHLLAQRRQRYRTPCAAIFRSTSPKRSGALRARSVCRLRCTRRVRARSSI